MVEENFPLSACPWCTSLNTVRTAALVTRAFFFCLACGKGFERRLDVEAGSSPQPPKPYGA